METPTVELGPAALTRIVQAAAEVLSAQRGKPLAEHTPIEQYSIRAAVLPYVAAITPVALAEVQRALQEAATELPVVPDDLSSL
jgi:hypothetical protein